MGQAKRRGSFEERKELAIIRQQERLSALELKRRLRSQQEDVAYDIMVWWQLEMSEQRYAQIVQKRTNANMMLASFLGVAYGSGWNTLRI